MHKVTAPVRILLADDHPIFRDGLRRLLETEPGFRVIGEASDGAEAVKLARKLNPDILLLDLAMPNHPGLEAVRELGSGAPLLRIILLTAAIEKEQIVEALQFGARGVVLKESATQLLISVGMKRSEAMRALLPLTRQVLDNFQHVGPGAAWTGPLQRGDFRVVEAHLRALYASREEIAHAYESLNRLAACVLAQDAVATLAELEKISAALKPKVKARGGYG